MIAIDGLQAGYNRLEILHNITVSLPSDRFTVIVGPNGSGKSTLLKSIFGITDIFSGTIHYQQTNLVGLSTAQIGRMGIAYVPQRDNIFAAMSVSDNLRLAVRRLASDKQNAMLSDVYDLFPILKKREGQQAGQLSGGERQMVAMAIGWLMQPSVMLLDEPTAGLAPRVATEVFQTLQQLQQDGISLIVVEQNARRALQWCDYAYVMREGQIAFQGTAEECLSDEDTIKNYLGVGIGKSFQIRP
jgi:branched-chain amino acid transport system ATP-binding protein